MKYNRIFIGFLISFFLLQCATQTAEAPKEPIDFAQKNEEDQWDITVFDTQYDYFLSTIAKPIDFYSEDYYKNKNTFYVMEWNNRYYSGQNRDFYEVPITYDSQEKYGLQFEYKLYNFFKFVEWKYPIKF